MTYYRITLESTIAQCEQLRRCVRAFSCMEGYNQEFCSILELTLHEAFVNAVLHGNRKKTGSVVTILFSSDNRTAEKPLVVRVRDCGEGFSMQAIDDPTGKDGLSALSGRGLYLVRHFAESVVHESGVDGSIMTLNYIPYRERHLTEYEHPGTSTNCQDDAAGSGGYLHIKQLQ